MRWLFAAALLSTAAPAALAADPPPTTPAAESALISYPSAFFAPMGPETAYDMVLRIPGFVFDDGSVVRGFAGAAGNVLIDGQRPTSKTDDLAGILQRLPAGAVERIDLIRGGAAGIDMQGKTVVANVVRRKAGGFSGDISLFAYKPEDIEVDPGVKLEGAWSGGGRTLEGSLLISRYHDDNEHNGPHDVFGPDGKLIDVSPQTASAPAWQNMITTAYETPLWGGRFKANLVLEDQPYDNTNIDTFRIAGRQSEHDAKDQTDGELGLHFERDLSSDLTMEVLGLQHLNKTGSSSVFTTMSDNEVFDLSDFGGESVARGIAHWRPSAELTVDGGGEFAFNWLKTRTVFSDNGLPIALPAADVEVEEKRGEAFTTATWRPSSKLTLEAGVRVEDSTIASTGDVVLSKTLMFPKPRLVATWTPDPDDQLRVRVEREVGQLDFSDFTAAAALNSSGVAAGNPNITPQTDWAFEAAYDRHFWKDGVISLTLRHMILKDVIDRVPVFSASGVFDEPGNIGGGTEDDLVGSFSLPLARFGIPGGVIRGLGTWRFSEVIDPTTGEKRGISGQHPLDAELHFAQDLPQWKLNWGIDSTIGYLERFYRFDEIDSNRKGTWNSVFVVYKARPDLTLRFELDNLSRRTYTITRDVFAGPRNVAPLDFIDVQERRWGLTSFLRIRKSFQ